MNNTKVQHAQNVKEGDHAFDQSSVLKVLIKNSFPLVLLMIANSFYTLIDALLAIRFVTVENHGYNGGDVVGAVFPLAQLLMAFSMFYVVGIGLYYSKRLGQDKYDSAERGVSQAMLMSVVMGVILYVVLFIIVDPYVSHLIDSSKSFAVTSDAFPDVDANIEAAKVAGKNFLLVIGLSAIPLSIMNCLVRALRSEGKGPAASVIPMLPIPLNLGFDIIMMGVLGTGIWGAAFATFFASLVTMIIAIGYVVFEKAKDNTYISFKIGLWKPIWPTIFVIIVFGATSFIRRMGTAFVMVSLSTHITSLGNFDISATDTYLLTSGAISNFLASISDSTIRTTIDAAVTTSDEWAAAFNAMARTLIIPNRISLGIAQSVAMICAYHYGRRNWKRINQTLMWGFAGVLLITGIMSAILIGASNPLIKSFGVHPDDPNFITYQMAYIYGGVFVFMNGMVLIPIMFYSSQRNIRATLVHVFVVTIILFSATFIGKPIAEKCNNDLAYFYTMLVGAFFANLAAVILFSVNLHKMNKNVKLYDFPKKPKKEQLLINISAKSGLPK